MLDSGLGQGGSSRARKGGFLCSIPCKSGLGWALPGRTSCVCSPLITGSDKQEAEGRWGAVGGGAWSGCRRGGGPVPRASEPNPEAARDQALESHSPAGDPGPRLVPGVIEDLPAPRPSQGCGPTRLVGLHRKDRCFCYPLPPGYTAAPQSVCQGWEPSQKRPGAENSLLCGSWSPEWSGQGTGRGRHQLRAFSRNGAASPGKGCPWGRGPAPGGVLVGGSPRGPSQGCSPGHSAPLASSVPSLQQADGCRSGGGGMQEPLGGQRGCFLRWVGSPAPGLALRSLI